VFNNLTIKAAQSWIQILLNRVDQTILRLRSKSVDRRRPDRRLLQQSVSLQLQIVHELKPVAKELVVTRREGAHDATTALEAGARIRCGRGGRAAGAAAAAAAQHVAVGLEAERLCLRCAEMGNCYLKKKSITNYITNCFYTK
jgi:hypothetical protein